MVLIERRTKAITSKRGMLRNKVFSQGESGEKRSTLWMVASVTAPVLDRIPGAGRIME